MSHAPRLKTYSIYFVLAFCAVTALVLLITSLQKNSESQNSDGLQLSTPKQKLVVQEITVPLNIQLMGTVTPRIITNLSSEATGRVVKADVYEGQLVDAGQLLVAVDEQNYRTELDRAIQEAESRQVAMKTSKVIFERTDRLLKKEAATQTEWDKARGDYLSQLALFQASESYAKSVLIQYEKTQVQAPYTGIIGKKIINEGDFVTIGSPLFLFYPVGEMDVEFILPEKYITFLALGQRLPTAIEINNTLTHSIVYKASPYEDSLSRTFQIKARIENYESTLSGGFAKVTLPIGEKTIIAIPKSAITTIGQLEIVQVLNEGKWRRQYIRTGENYNGMLEVFSGLSGGEVIGYDE